MKLRMEVDESIKEDEILIRCSAISSEIQQLQSTIANLMKNQQQIPVYKGNTEYYISPKDILFFETEDKTVIVHTAEHCYRVDYKLYELEALLSGDFARISKSAIVNTSVIYALTKNITGASIIEFRGTAKKVYVSRHYYKPLRDRLEERRRLL